MKKYQQTNIKKLIKLISTKVNPFKVYTHTHTNTPYFHTKWKQTAVYTLHTILIPKIELLSLCESPSLYTEMNVLSRSLTFNFRINIIRTFVNRKTSYFRKLSNFKISTWLTLFGSAIHFRVCYACASFWNFPFSVLYWQVSPSNLLYFI